MQSLIHPFRLLLLIALLNTAVLAQTPAMTVPLLLPSAVVFDLQGNLYIAETNNHVIRRVDVAGQITIVAGDGTQGFSGDSGLAIEAQLDSPQGLAVTGTTLYIADTHNQRIRRVDLLTGTITTVAGTGVPSFSGDAAPAARSTLNLPNALTVDTLGNLYISDSANHRIRKIGVMSGAITTIAGTGIQGYSGDTGLAIAARIDSPNGLAADLDGNLYLSDTHNHRIRKITASTGVIATIVGTGIQGQSIDASLATRAQVALPRGLTVDMSGNVYFSDTANHRIRRIDVTTGLITTIAGNLTQGYTGNSMLAAAAMLDSPRAVVLSPTGQVTVADTANQRIRQINTVDISTIAGLGNTIPGILSLASPSVIAYGTGRLTATLSTPTSAAGSITFLEIFANRTVPLATSQIAANAATLSTSGLPTGVHTIFAAYLGDLTHSAAQSPAFALTILPAPTLTTLTGTRSTLTAQVLSTTTGIPGGALIFLEANSIAATALLSSGVATLSLPALSAGSHTFVASYAGDLNFQASTSTLTFTVAPTEPASDFILAVTGSTTQTILAGAVTTFTFNAQTSGSLNSPILLAATGLPAGATASFSPTYLPPGATSNPFNLAITTLKSTAQLAQIRLAALLLFPFLFGFGRLQRSAIVKVCALFTLTLATLITGCGARINTGNAVASTARTYTIVVTGTATASTGAPLVHTAEVTLTLQ